APPPAQAPRRRTLSNPPLTARAPTPGSIRRTGEYPGYAPAPQGTVPALNRTPAHGVPQPGLSRTPAHGVPQPGLSRTPAHGVPQPGRPPAPRGTPAFGVAPFGAPPQQAFPTFAPERVPRDTARVQPLRPRARWRGTVVILLLILGGGAAAVNRWVVPVDVLLVWRNPAGLAIATDPDGASLRLDGVPLAGSAPTTVMVRRDLTEHVIEATYPGYLPARMAIRYDKTLALSVFVPLEKDPAAAAVRPTPAAH
ncbi:MAG TPA: PEGA domain-containing protein, partial [Polyangia bacterium]|nr:PEGA domain-containing protein [Polyangia bacterium]